MQVDAFKNLEETMHVQLGHLSQDSTFDLFEFLSKIFFFQNLSFQTRVAAYLRVHLHATLAERPKRMKLTGFGDLTYMTVLVQMNHN